ncbi:MAG: DNA repair protein RadA [Salinivirgaceae bacterium]|nr:DNA repair protein RadA [Salinivirgaceae bacterium]
MSKIKTAFFCTNCGTQHSKWSGKCNACNEWNTIVEEVIVVDKQKKTTLGDSRPKPVLLSSIDVEETPRLNTFDKEFDRVLGGGLVPGSIVLLGGEPGIGKSTLMLQVALNMPEKKIFYVSGEESYGQIKMRAERINTGFNNLYLYSETNTLSIITEVENLKPDIVIIDSIQTTTTPYIDSSAGSVSQVRESAAELQRFAKQSNIPFILIGHITKDGSIAGPKVLEHMVDVVMQFEGDRNHGYRILRTSKNRFGSTAEIGIYEMESYGLREVSNPSEILISHREESTSGVAIAVNLEGNRVLMIETQALVSPAVYGTPQRSTTGFDARRLNMLLAVLEKRCGFRLGAKDVFLNITGGIKVDDPAIDLAIVASILSSNEDIPIDPGFCFAAEVGLSGEIRPIPKIEQRIAEAQKLGYRQIFISKYNLKGLNQQSSTIRIKALSRIEDMLSEIF